jgi:hypothetical protein
MIILGTPLFLLSFFLWIFVTYCGLSQHDSDPAGNAMSQAFAALATILLWIFLTLLLLVAVLHGQISSWSVIITLILLPISGLCAFASIYLMGRERTIKSPIIVPAIVPVLWIAYATWCFFPAIHSTTGFTWPPIIVWATTLLLLPVPLIAHKAHQRALAAIPPKTPGQLAQEQAQRAAEQHQQLVESFQKLTPDSPLREWWRYFNEFRKPVLEGARNAKTRQADVIAMLPDSPRSLFLAIPQLNLQVTPELEQAARAYLRDQVARLMPYTPNGPNTTKIVTEWYEDYFPTIQWLRENKATMDEELTQLSTAVQQYPDTSERQKFLSTLQSLQTPK